MKKITKIISIVLMCCFAIGCLSGCSTNLGKHMNTFFSEISQVFEKAHNYNEIINEANNPKKDENTLDSPANFTVSADGDYSFDAVENADSYVISVYETSGTLTATGTKTIQSNGGDKYTGKISDFVNLSYDEWFIRVVAYPAEGSTLNESAASYTSYIVRGTVENGTLTKNYIWNACSGDLTLYLSGFDGYRSTAYPTNVEIALTNKTTKSVYTAKTGKISSSSASVIMTLPKLDATYSIALNCTWDETFVTNASWTTSLPDVTVSASESSMSGDMSYSSGIFNSFDFPFVFENFNVNAVPTDQTYAEVALDDGIEFGTYSTGNNQISFKAYPLWTEKGYSAKEGATKSFDVRIKGSSAITATPKNSPGSGSTNIIFGQLDFYADGTFDLELEYQYIKTDGMNDGVYYVPGIICEGIYTINADGTYTLSYDYSNAYESKYSIVQELNGRASFYSEVDPDWKNSGSQGGGGNPGGGGGGGDFAFVYTNFNFDATAASFQIALGSHQLLSFTATKNAAATAGSTYSYTLTTNDTGAPFAIVSSMEFKEDGTMTFHIGAAGPLSETTKTGTWVQDGDTVTVTWD